MKHWTQTPEGREKLSRIQQKRWRNYRDHVEGTNNKPLITALQIAPEQPVNHTPVDFDSYKAGYRDGFTDGRKLAKEGS